MKGYEKSFLVYTSEKIGVQTSPILDPNLS